MRGNKDQIEVVGEVTGVVLILVEDYDDIVNHRVSPRLYEVRMKKGE